MLISSVDSVWAEYVLAPNLMDRKNVVLQRIEPFWLNCHGLVWFSSPIRFHSPLFPLICCVLSVVSRTEEEEHQTKETYCQIPLQYDSFPNLSATMHVFEPKKCNKICISLQYYYTHDRWWIKFRIQSTCTGKLSEFTTSHIRILKTKRIVILTICW